MSAKSAIKWKLWNRHGPMHDGQVMVKRIGPEEGGLTTRGLWIGGTEEHLKLVCDSVNAHPIAIQLAHAVLQEDRDRSDWLGKIIRLAEKFKKAGGVQATPWQVSRVERG